MDKEAAFQLAANDYVGKPNSGLLFSELVLMLKETYLVGMSNA